MRIRNLLIAALMGTSLLAGQAAEASSIGDAFNGLLAGTTSATTNGGIFSGKTRTTITGGGYNINFAPSQNVNLISITPPSLSAGCGGISAFFGGLSYINGAQIQQLLQNISQGVTAGLFLAAMGAICPQCEQWIAKAEDWLQKASSLAINGCQMGMSIAQDMANKVHSETDHKCVNLAAATNTASDTLAASQSTCNGQSATLSYLSGVWTSAFGSNASSTAPTAVNECVALQNVAGTGNTTWAALHSIGGWVNYPYVSDLLMSLVGTTAYDETKKTYAPTGSLIDANQFIAFYECGTSPASWTQTAYLQNLVQSAGTGTLNVAVGGNSMGTVFTNMQSYCLRELTASAYQNTAAKVLACVDSSGNVSASAFTNGCPSVKAVSAFTMGSWGLNAKGGPGAEGFDYYVLNTLAKGVYEIANNKALTTDVIELINVSPFPLYKALNIAAVYPSVSATILSDNAQALGMMLSLAYIRHELKMIKSGVTGKPVCLPAGVLKAYHRAEMLMSDQIQVKFQQINTIYAHEQMVINQVKDVNQSILNNIYSDGLMSAAFKR